MQHERGPRNSTIRRQVAMYLKESTELSAVAAAAAGMLPPHFRGVGPFLPAGAVPPGGPGGAAPVSLPSPGGGSLEPLPGIPNGVLIQPTPKVSRIWSAFFSCGSWMWGWGIEHHRDQLCGGTLGGLGQAALHSL